LPKIKKSENSLQPIFEALTNAFESLAIEGGSYKNHKIIIRAFFNKNLLSDSENTYDFKEFQVEDNGVGFNDTECNRAIALNDTRKGFSNKGTGRVQFVHFFDKTQIESIYKDQKSSSGYFRGILELSKKKPFLDENAIINHLGTNEINSDNNKTIVSLIDPLEENDISFYNNLDSEQLKSSILSHFLIYLCNRRKTLPSIKIEFRVGEKIIGKCKIDSKDLPKVNYETDISIPYRLISTDGKKIETSVNERETFNLKSFLIDGSKLPKNELILTSKGQRAKEIKLKTLSSNDHINNKRYLFLLSGDYIDKSDTDTRGNINIPTLEKFKKTNSELFNGKAIVIEDIEEETNQVIEKYYSEIKKKANDKIRNIEKLKEMFLLNEETIKSLNVGLNDSDDQILKRVYESDIKIIAKRDAEIKQQIEQLESLDPKSPTYKNELEVTINELVKSIPLQNRTTLTHYVARRKLVLDLFQKVLDQQLVVLKNGGRIDEKIMHNLIFQQSSEDPSDSDLWIINEEFIYFNGCSEQLLRNVEVQGEKIFKDEFEFEEERYLSSLGNRRLDRKPDILLFPEDSKCIIIELKAPDINASFHLNQIDMYASLIYNFSKDKFKIAQFYGYLIGESIEPKDVMGAVHSYEESPHFKYLFRPSQKVRGFDGKDNGSIYSEVIKYSTLLKRAKLRNKVFIDKLTD